MRTSATVIGLLLALAGCANAPRGTTSGTPNTPATFARVGTPSSAVSGPVAIPFTLADADSDVCLVTAEFSSDDGATWKLAREATRSGSTSVLAASPSGSEGVFVWDAGLDLRENSSHVRVRLRAHDRASETSIHTESFTVLGDPADPTIDFDATRTTVVVEVVGDPAKTSVGARARIEGDGKARLWNPRVGPAREVALGRDAVAGLLLFAKEKGFWSMQDGAFDGAAPAVYRITIATRAGTRVVESPVNSLPEGFLDIFNRLSSPVDKSVLAHGA